MSNKQGQQPVAQKDFNNLYRLTLTKKELVAIRVALQLDLEALTELQDDEPEWKQLSTMVGNILTKVRLQEQESE